MGIEMGSIEPGIQLMGLGEFGVLNSYVKGVLDIEVMGVL